MNLEGAIANGWLAFEFSDRLSVGPSAYRVAGKRIVAWRAHGCGRVILFEDRCPHRGAALSNGKIEDNRLICPYHGVGFDADGSPHPSRTTSCTAGATCVRSMEALGLVWACFSGAPEPTFPGELLKLSSVRYRFADEITCGPLNIIDNSFDTEHFPHVHGALFGSTRSVPEPTYEVTNYGFRSQYVVPIDPHGPFADAVGHDASAADVIADYIAPLCQVFQVRYDNGTNYVTVQAASPTVGPDQTAYFQVCLAGREHVPNDRDTFLQQADFAIWQEDRRILVSISDEFLRNHFPSPAAWLERHSKEIVLALARLQEHKGV